MAISKSKVLDYLAPVIVIAALLGLASVELEVPDIKLERPAIETRDRFFGVAVLNQGKTIWAVGKDAKVVRSDDGGAHWAIQQMPVFYSAQDIAAWNDQEAVIVANEGSALYTADGGKTWTQAPRLPVSDKGNGKVFRVVIDARGWAWAVSEFSVILVSRDKGHTWSQASPDDQDEAWNAIAFASETDACVVGEHGRIACTRDGGETWGNVANDSPDSLFSVAFRDAQNGVAVGVRGTVRLTQDGGNTWQPAPSAELLYHLNDVIWDGTRWVLVGDRGLLVFGSADGSTWTPQRLAEENYDWHTRVAVAGPETYWVAGASLGRWSRGEWVHAMGTEIPQLATAPAGAAQ